MLLSGAKRLSCLCIRIKEDSQNCTKYHGIKLSSHKMKLPGRIIEQNLWHETNMSGNQFALMLKGDGGYIHF